LPTLFQNSGGGGENREHPRLASRLEKFVAARRHYQHAGRVRYPENSLHHFHPRHWGPFVVKSASD